MGRKPSRFFRRDIMKYRGMECLNCGHPLQLEDRFCPHCSQRNTNKKLEASDFLNEFLGSILSWDSKLVRTLSSLLLRPGTISKEFIDGKRARYTNPFRFLLSLAIIYFLVVNFGHDFRDLDRSGSWKENPNDTTLIQKVGLLSIKYNNQSLQEGMKALDSLQALQASGTLDSLGLKNIRGRIEAMSRRQDSLIWADPVAYSLTLDQTRLFTDFGKKRMFFENIMDREGEVPFETIREKYGLQDTYSNRTTYTVAHNLYGMVKRPGAYIEYLLSKLPFLTFFFLPCFALFVGLVYIRKKYNYADHLIFSFHNTSLLFILLLVSLGLDRIFGLNTMAYAFLGFTIYLYLAMRNFYGQGRFKTLLKFTALNIVFFILAVCSFFLFILGSVFIYN